MIDILHGQRVFCSRKADFACCEKKSRTSSHAQLQPQLKPLSSTIRIKRTGQPAPSRIFSGSIHTAEQVNLGIITGRLELACPLVRCSPAAAAAETNQQATFCGPEAIIEHDDARSNAAQPVSTQHEV